MNEIAGLVPQVFYDLIGRFIPGVVMLALGVLLFVDLSIGAPLPSLARAIIEETHACDYTVIT